jgi:hypothetical protein
MCFFSPLDSLSVFVNCLNNDELEWQDFDHYLKDGGKSYLRNKTIAQILKQLK